MPAPLATFFVYVWPEPLSSAAGLRTYELARLLKGAGYEVHAYSPCAENEAFHAWRADGVHCHPCPLNDSGVEEVLRAQSPRLVIYDRFVVEEQFGWRLRALWPEALHLVDTQDLHAVRRARERALKRGAPEPEPADYGEDLVRELASLHRADAALVVAPWEKVFLGAQGYPEERVLALPFSAAPEPAPPGFVDRAGFCFLGNYRHAPNLDAARFLLREVWPEIRRTLPSAELSFYGAYPGAELSAQDGKRGVHAAGFVRDHRAALRRHRALLAPLRFGAGLKGKVLEAWATGTPVVGSQIALEGTGLGAADSLDPVAFAAAAVRAHEEEADWEERRRAGAASLAAHFTPERVREAFLSFLQEAYAARPGWREALVGRMLRLQQNNATKYFSLWIEAKNKRSAPP